MRRYVVWAAVLSVYASILGGCSLFETKSDLPYYDPTLYAAKATPVVVPTPSFAWAGGNEYAVVVRKQERTLTLYRWGQQEKVYPIVLGIAPQGPKTYQGDLRTPEGVYRIVVKREHDRWSRFMLLSYPNDIDRQRYASALNTGRVPIIDGNEPGLGGAVGIHGTDRESSNVRGIDWTWGCVSLLNEHVNELYDLIPLYTAVLIEE